MTDLLPSLEAKLAKTLTNRCALAGLPIRYVRADVDLVAAARALEETVPIEKRLELTPVRDDVVLAELHIDAEHRLRIRLVRLREIRDAMALLDGDGEVEDDVTA